MVDRQQLDRQQLDRQQLDRQQLDRQQLDERELVERARVNRRPRDAVSDVHRARRRHDAGEILRPGAEGRAAWGGARAVLLLGLGLLAAAAVLYVVAVEPAPASGPMDVPWWGLAAGFFAAEVAVVHFHFRHEAHSFSMSELPIVFGLFFAAPAEVVAAQLLGAGGALIVHRRQRGVKLVLNLGHFALCTTVAIVIFQRVVADAPVGGPRSWAGALLAAIAASAVGTIAIFVAIAMSERRVDLRKLPEETWLALLVSVAGAALALVGVNAVLHEPAAGWLLLVPTGIFFVTYRAYVVARQRHRDLGLLYESSRILHESADLNSGVARLLANIRETLRAEVAEVLISTTGPHEPALRISFDGARSETTISLDPVEADDPLVAAAAQGPALALNRRRHGPQENLLARRGLRDALVVPLRGEQRTSGAMLLGNRLGEGSRFDGHDLVVMEALAAQVGVFLEKGHLRESLAAVSEHSEQLRHKALHDSLTGLANRELFTERLQRALGTRRRPEAGVAVLFVDLDDFKAVNDSLGHAAGDELLVGAADRLQSCLRPADVAARLGGDEFAVLLPGVDRAEEAVAVVDRIIADRGRDFVVGGSRARVQASIGVAVAPGGGETASDLLDRADAAMYRAKTAGKGRYALAAPATSVDPYRPAGRDSRRRRA